MWKSIAVVTAIVAILLAAILLWPAREPGPATPQPDTTAPPAEVEQPAPDSAPTQQPPEEQTQAKPAAPKGFCERDFEQVAEREADASELRAAGGLVHIFEREARLSDPYGCADFYLAHGLDIDAVDPRADGERLTGLFFAIKRNDPKMLRFMLEHDADLQKRAGKKETKAMGYAYYLALQNQRIDRNQIIGMLDQALTRQAASQ